ncbi:MAG: GspH/FimT family pseudopilin [Caulobacterales bacterium]|jgi:general secretion pathway protein H
MPISATRRARHDPEAGFSLIEALLVLMIIGLAASAVVLLAPTPGSATRDAARAFAARLALAGDESVLRNRALALAVTPEGYGFAVQEQAGWVAISDARALAFRPWPENVAVRFSASRQSQALSVAEAPYPVQFDAIGSATPIVATFVGQGASWIVALDSQGALSVAPEQ